MAVLLGASASGYSGSKIGAIVIIAVVVVVLAILIPYLRHKRSQEQFNDSKNK